MSGWRRGQLEAFAAPVGEAGDEAAGVSGAPRQQAGDGVGVHSTDVVLEDLRVDGCTYMQHIPEQGLGPPWGGVRPHPCSLRDHVPLEILWEAGSAQRLPRGGRTACRLEGTMLELGLRGPMGSGSAGGGGRVIPA